MDFLNVFSKRLFNTARSNDDDPLQKEKTLVSETIEHLEFFQGFPEGVNRQKNAPDSKLYRLKGNELFKSESHDQVMHQKILERYSQSIALAPNKSEELAMAYGNRSALLQHVKKYRESVEDCDRAIDITKSDLLKAKLTCRKIECLEALGNKSLRDECEKASELLTRVTLDDQVKENYMARINSIHDNTLSVNNSSAKGSKSEKKTKKFKKQPDPSGLFEHQKEIPCASQALTIAHSKQWGRHIIATQNIEAGEVVAVEKHFHKFVFPGHLYLCCNYCARFSWSSIPCESCIYGVYCSNECRAAAWEKFHKFECKIFPHVWDIAGELVSAPHGIRFFLSLVHRAGGIEQLKHEFMKVQKSEDPRSKGFSDDGTFQSDDYRCVLGLEDYSNDCGEEMESSFAFNAAVALFYLVRETNFFGKKMNDSLTFLINENHDIEFVGAIYLRVSYLPLTYGSQLLINSEKDNDSVGLYMSPFCGLFNHSCTPNVRFIRSKNNETIVYARHPIKKGEQLFRSYLSGDFNDGSKKERTDKLKVYQVTCTCLACKKNWGPNSLPEAWDIMEKKHNQREVAKFHKKIQHLVNECIIPSLRNAKSLKKMFRVKCNQCKPGYLEEVLAMQKEIASKASVHCREYECLDEYVYMYYLGTFGRWLDVPEIC